jgi:hypothetical protein
VNKLGPYFTYEQLITSELNPAIMHYISAEIDFLIFEDRQKLLRNSVFDYSGEKINQLFSQIGDEVKRTKRFSVEYISKLILHASSFTINFLVRPKWTLVKFVFDEGQHKTTSEIKQILNYLYYYKHLKTILISYINTKKIISMNAEEFTALFEKVDSLGVETYLPSVLTGSLKSMAEFFNIGEVQKNKIPLIAVLTFLEEKNLSKHVEKMKEVFGEDDNLKFSINEYQKVFDSIMNEKEEVIESEVSADIFEPVVVEEHDIDVPEEEMVIEKPEESLAENEPEVFSEEEVEEDIHDELENDQEEIAQDLKEEIEEVKPAERKTTKIRINIKKNNEIEKIELPEEQNEEVPQNAAMENEEEENDLFHSFEENVIEDIVEDPGQPEEILEEEQIEQSEDEIKEDEFENVEEIVDSLMDKKDNYLDFTEDEEVQDIYDEADKTLREIEEKLNSGEEDEKESMLQSILGNKENDDFNEEELTAVPKNKGRASGESKKMDLAELLEHKDMTKIIEVVFDYDIEEFSNTLEDIMDCDDLDSATGLINQTLKQHGINRKSKEAELFKQIISEFFNRR